MAELKTLTIDGTSNSIDSGDYVRYDANGIYLPLTSSLETREALSLPNNAMTDYSLFTAPVTGMYWISSNAEFSANATGSRYFSLRYGSSASNAGGVMRTSAAPTGSTMYNISVMRNLTQGDSVVARYYQNSGSALTVKLTAYIVKIEE